MGIHDKNLAVLEAYFTKYPTSSVLELGAQNVYQNYGSVRYGSYADSYYALKGVKTYACIDLNGENHARVWDLSKPIPFFGEYQLVTDFGTCEHICPELRVEPLYNCWKTKFDASSRHILSANPKTNNWPKHGGYFFRPEFYQVLAQRTHMRILRLEEQFAMGNDKDGWEVMCLLEKTPSSKWISLEEFQQAFVELRPN